MAATDELIHVSNEEYDFSYPEAPRFKIHPSIELKRLEELDKIKEGIAAVLYKHKVFRPIKKKWTMRQAISQNLIGRALMHHANENVDDPLIPSNIDQDAFGRTLVDTFRTRDLTAEMQISAKFRDAVKAVKSFKPSRVQIKHRVSKNMRVFVLNYEGHPHRFSLLNATYLRMKERFVGKGFDVIVACLLIRYKALDTGGHQWAMPGSVKDMVPINFEMFASAFNAHYGHFCSMFPDLERFFGSVGPFQRVTFNRGFYMANPPYEVGVLRQMIDKIISSVEVAQKNGSTLAFIFGVPDWDDFDISHVKKAATFVKKVPPGGVPWRDHMTGETKRTPGNTRFIISTSNFMSDRIRKQIDDALDFWTSHD